MKDKKKTSVPLRLVAGPGPTLLLLGAAALQLSGCAATSEVDGPPPHGLDLAEVEDAVPRAEPKSKYGNPASYVVFGKRYYTKASAKGHVERGDASWYGRKFHGRRTSSGEPYNMYAMTAAHKTLPLPTYVEVTNLENGRTVVVRVNDRGPFHPKRVIDLSYAAAKKLGVVKRGVAKVEVRAIEPGAPEPEEDVLLAAASDDLDADVAPVRTKTAPAKETGDDAFALAAVAAVQRPAVVAAAGPDAAPEVTPMYLQVGAFGNRDGAEQLRRQLIERLAEQVEVRSGVGAAAPLYKVHVGPFDSREKADDISQKLASLGLAESLVVTE